MYKTGSKQMATVSIILGIKLYMPYAQWIPSDVSALHSNIIHCSDTCKFSLTLSA